MRNALFLALIALLLLGCTNPLQPPTPTGQAAKQAPGLKEFSIVAKTWEFIPSTITVNKGDKVRLKIKSIDVKHGFNLPDYDVRADVFPGQETTVEFVADMAGSFTFRCDVFCGAGHAKMKGTLEVKN